jgi:hypothetical protein
LYWFIFQVSLTPDMFGSVEDRTETWEQAKVLGLEIARKLGE